MNNRRTAPGGQTTHMLSAILAKVTNIEKLLAPAVHNLPDSEILDSKGVRLLTKMSDRTLLRRRNDGTLPFHRDKGKIYYRRSDVLRAMLLEKEEHSKKISVMKKMIKIESGSFAALVRSYKKSLNMLAVLQHICQENDVALSMLPDEVCELINLDPAEIEKQRLSGRLRFAEEENGTKHYSIVDIINLKDSIDWKVINRQVESLSFEEEE